MPGTPWLPDHDWGALRDLVALLADRTDRVEIDRLAADILRPEYVGTAPTPGKKLVWNAGVVFVANGGVATFAHGLGATPFFATADLAPGIGQVPKVFGVIAADATNISVADCNGSGGLNSNAYWIAAAIR